MDGGERGVGGVGRRLERKEERGKEMRGEKEQE